MIAALVVGYLLMAVLVWAHDALTPPRDLFLVVAALVWPLTLAVDLLMGEHVDGP